MIGPILRKEDWWERKFMTRRIPPRIEGWAGMIKERLARDDTSPAVEHVLLWPLDATRVFWSDASSGRQPGLAGLDEATGDCWATTLPPLFAYADVNILENLAAEVTAVFFATLVTPSFVICCLPFEYMLHGETVCQERR